MPEHVGSTLSEEGLHFVCCAIATLADSDPRRTAIFGETPAEVCLTVNGVEVPFSLTIQEIYERMSSEVNERAALLAAHKVDELKQVFEELLRDPLREFNERVAKIFDLPLERILDKYGELQPMRE